MAVNRFVVDPRFGRMPDPALVRSDLARALKGELGLAEQLRARRSGRYSRRPAGTPRRRPSVLWFDDAADATVLEFRGEDEIGLLYRITAALERGRARRPLGAGLVARPASWSTRSTSPTATATRSPKADRPGLEAALRTAWPR